MLPCRRASQKAQWTLWPPQCREAGATKEWIMADSSFTVKLARSFGTLKPLAGPMASSSPWNIETCMHAGHWRTGTEDCNVRQNNFSKADYMNDCKLCNVPIDSASKQRWRCVTGLCKEAAWQCLLFRAFIYRCYLQQDCYTTLTEMFAGSWMLSCGFHDNWITLNHADQASVLNATDFHSWVSWLMNNIVCHWWTLSYVKVANDTVSWTKPILFFVAVKLACMWRTAQWNSSWSGRHCQGEGIIRGSLMSAGQFYLNGDFHDMAVTFKL